MFEDGQENLKKKGKNDGKNIREINTLVNRTKKIKSDLSCVQKKLFKMKRKIEKQIIVIRGRSREIARPTEIFGREIFSFSFLRPFFFSCGKQKLENRRECEKLENSRCEKKKMR